MIVAMEKKLISELIDGYKSCTCLWWTKDPDYKNKDVKNEAYESLLQLIKKYNENFTMEDLKRKIANLRTCYLREFKKVMDAKRYGGVYGPSLWYYKSLEFLNDQHQGEDRGVWLVRSCNSDDNYESNETPPVLVYEDHAEDTDDPCSPEPQLTAGGTTVDATAAPVRLQQQGNNRPPPKKRRRVLDVLAGPSSCAAAADGYYEPQQVSYAAAAVDYYEPQVVGGVGVDPAEPPVADYYDGFGRYAANELRQMDWQSVIIAKRLVNEVLFLGQMGKLTVDTRIETPPPPPPPGTRKNGGDRDACSSPIPSVELMETS